MKLVYLAEENFTESLYAETEILFVKFFIYPLFTNNNIEGNLKFVPLYFRTT